MSNKLIFDFVFPGIFGLVGMVFLLIGIGILKNIKRKEKNCTSKTYGKVTDIVRHKRYDRDIGYVYILHPIVEYNVGNLKIEKESSSGSSLSKYEIGQEVEICYNPEDYNEYYIMGDTVSKTMGMINTIVGCIAIGIAIFSAISVL